MIVVRKSRLIFFLLLMTSGVSAYASTIPSHISSREELEYGQVLYEYYQKHWFDALVENSYASTKGNPLTQEKQGRLFKGGLMLSYGMADESQKVFEGFLNSNTPDLLRNRAWYFLARFYYNKSEFRAAESALGQVSGSIPKDLSFDYHYLKTLVDRRVKTHGDHSEVPDESLKSSPQYPYLVFNAAINKLSQGELVSGVNMLEQVASHPAGVEEYAVLSDRAKLGLAQIAMQKGRFDDAWAYLSSIRTTGLYSNRALLNYAWAAIKVENFEQAIAALKLLSSRSIASPEVQESKVLLAHLYEQEGSPRKALKANLLSIKHFTRGVGMVEKARRIIDKKDVPEEFITNMDAIMDDSDWHSATPDVDYKNLTPFLIDLMSSNPFNETLKELADLYYLRKNLNYWLMQANEHLVVMDSATSKAFEEKNKQLIDESRQLQQQLAEKKSELSLMNLTLDSEDQHRMDVLLESTQGALDMLGERVDSFDSFENVYVMPASYKPETLALHKRIKELLEKTDIHIVKLEPVMRSLVKAELDKHEERMNYYSAQSRLAKARLYDTTLSTLRDAKRSINKTEGKK